MVQYWLNEWQIFPEVIGQLLIAQPVSHLIADLKSVVDDIGEHNDLDFELLGSEHIDVNAVHIKVFDVFAVHSMHQLLSGRVCSVSRLDLSERL